MSGTPRRLRGMKRHTSDGELERLYPFSESPDQDLEVGAPLLLASEPLSKLEEEEDDDADDGVGQV